MTKTKIILFSIVGILVLAFIFSLLKKFDGGGVSTQSIAPVRSTEKFTWRDMASARDDKNNSINKEKVIIRETRSQFDTIYSKIEQTPAEKEPVLSPEVLNHHVKEAEEAAAAALPKKKVELTKKTNTKTKKPPVNEDEPEEVQRKTEIIEIGGSSEKGGSGQEIKAVIYNEQRVMEGDLVKILTKSEASYNGYKIPPGTIVYGQVHFVRNRAEITISNMMINDKVIPVSLKVYGKDAQSGILISGGDIKNTSEEIKQGAYSQTNTGIRIIDGAKNTIQNALKSKPKVTLKDGTKIILK